MAKQKTKSSFNSVQTMNKSALLRKFLLSTVIVIIIIAIIATIQLYIGRRKEAEKAALASKPTMVPSSIKYYDPKAESSYETSSNYVILSENGKRIMVDSEGNASYVNADNKTLSILSGQEREEALNNALKIMGSDSQANLALYGLDALLAKEEEAMKKAEEEREAEAQRDPIVLTADQKFDEMVTALGLSPDAVRSAVQKNGGSMNELYLLIDMTNNPESVIRSVMESANKKEAENAKAKEEGNKVLSVEVSTLGNPNKIINSEEETVDTGYPEWMKEPDITEGLTATLNNLVSAATAQEPLPKTEYESANNQSDKQDFLDKNQSKEFSSNKITKYDLIAGTVVPITMQTGLNTDLPGEVIGKVRQDVYDSLTGTEILIPKGSTLMASYNSSVSFGQRSVQIAWTQMITPDGYQYTLPGFQGVSPEGYTGVEDKYKSHFWSILGGAILGSIIDYGATELGSQAEKAAGLIPGSELITAGADVTINTISSMGKKYTDMWMNRQPTVIIRPGAQIQMMVNQTLNMKKDK